MGRSPIISSDHVRKPSGVPATGEAVKEGKLVQTRSATRPVAPRLEPSAPSGKVCEKTTADTEPEYCSSDVVSEK